MYVGFQVLGLKASIPSATGLRLDASGRCCAGDLPCCLLTRLWEEHIVLQSPRFVVVSCACEKTSHMHAWRKFH